MRRLLKPKFLYRYTRIGAYKTKKRIRDFLGDNFPVIPQAEREDMEASGHKL